MPTQKTLQNSEAGGWGGGGEGRDVGLKTK